VSPLDPSEHSIATGENIRREEVAMNDVSTREIGPPNLPVSHVLGVDGLLADGQAVLVRPVKPGDAKAARRPARASSPGAPRRIYATHPSLMASEMSHFTTVDYRERMAFVVLAEDRVSRSRLIA